MEVLKPGHCYLLDHLDGNNKTLLQFVQRKPLHEPVEGVTNQEVLRAVIDRVKFLDKEVPWHGNADILYHLRAAIGLHEARAIERHIEKRQLAVENVELDSDGHFKLYYKDE